MKYHHAAGNKITSFEAARVQFLKWNTIMQRTGLKPRRFLQKSDAVYFGTSEGWFRLSYARYSKPEVHWIRKLLEYLDESSFQNWAVSWRKTIVWEENDHCYLIQPWVMNGDSFQRDDPASIQRIAEIMADFYRTGKGYVESKGIEIRRDRWSTLEVEWEESLKKIAKLKIDSLPEKIRGGMVELQKELAVLIRENINNWRSSGIHSLLDHQRRAGVLGHGNLISQNILWQNNDLALLNWEYLAFQPRILDLATLINDASNWEPDWILFIIGEFSKAQPFWREEYTALRILLRHPYHIIRMLERTQPEELERKFLKEAVKELARKERCLGKVWRELGTEKRWGGGILTNNSGIDRLSMVLSPVETWGEYNGPDSVIRVRNEAKLPEDVMERLTYFEQNRIVGGRDGSVLDGSVLPVTRETEIVPEKKTEDNPGAEFDTGGGLSDVPLPDILIKEESSPPENSTSSVHIIQWGNFPKK